jgi:hypothetical protein
MRSDHSERRPEVHLRIDSPIDSLASGFAERALEATKASMWTLPIEFIFNDKSETFS